MTIDHEIIRLLKRIAEALERIAPPPGAPEQAAQSNSMSQEEDDPPDASAYALLKRLNVQIGRASCRERV